MNEGYIQHGQTRPQCVSVGVCVRKYGIVLQVQITLNCVGLCYELCLVMDILCHRAFTNH